MIMITKTAERLVEIRHEIKDLARDAFAGKITYYTAVCKAQELDEEKERLWALERSPEA